MRKHQNVRPSITQFVSMNWPDTEGKPDSSPSYKYLTGSRLVSRGFDSLTALRTLTKERGSVMSEKTAIEVAIENIKSSKYDTQRNIVSYFEYGKYPDDSQFKAIIGLTEDLKMMFALLDALENCQ